MAREGHIVYRRQGPTCEAKAILTEENKQENTHILPIG